MRRAFILASVTGAAALGFPAGEAVAFLKARWMDLKRENSDG